MSSLAAADGHDAPGLVAKAVPYIAAEGGDLIVGFEYTSLVLEPDFDLHPRLEACTDRLDFRREVFFKRLRPDEAMLSPCRRTYFGNNFKAMAVSVPLAICADE